MKERIAFVVQRYGTEVNGGSEYECRMLAEHLTPYFDVEVITTCSMDYDLWDNHFSEGEENINGVIVKRFLVERFRDKQKLNSIRAKIKSNNLDNYMEWVEENGPYCPGLIKYIDDEHKKYKAVIFITYNFYTAVCGMLLNLDNAVFLPTAHNAPPLYYKFYKDVFACSKGYIYNSIEEKKLVEEVFNAENVPSVVTCAGIDEIVINENNTDDVVKKYTNDEYMIYVGRIDGAKGCNILVRNFLEYKKRNPGNIKLLMVGKIGNDFLMTDSPDIIYTGFVSDEDKYILIRNAKFLVLNSQYESLSLVVLESLALNRPVLVNEDCDVLKGHCIRSNAGLYFNNYFEFEYCINFMLKNQDIYNQMCDNGKKYIDKNYRWSFVIGNIVKFIMTYQNAK